MRYPKFLNSNGTIGFIAPSFGCAGLEPYHTRFKSALEFFKEQGFSSIIGENVYLDDGIGKSTTPEKCGEEINKFFLDKESDVLISVGGGETMCEDLEYVDFQAIASAEPKWFLGYSDNTNLTFTLPTLCDTAAVYGPCASSFGMRPLHPYLTDSLDFICGKKSEFSNYDFWEIESLSSEENPLAPLNATEPFSMSIYKDGQLFSFGTDGHNSSASKESGTSRVSSDKVSCTEQESEANRPNFSKYKTEFTGRLLGGCLDILTILCGTRYDKAKEFNEKYSDDGIIWFLEACDLNPLSILRSLWQLKNAGWFEKTKGFLIGRPLHIKEYSFGIDCKEAVISILKSFNVPIILDIDIGHLPPSMPIVSGALGKVKASGNSLSIAYQLI